MCIMLKSNMHSTYLRLLCLSVLVSISTADIDFTSQFALTNPLLGGSLSLSSTPLNDSVLVVSSDTSTNQTWFFTPTSRADYYRLHTLQKGNESALDVDNYYGENSIDLHFYYVQERSGQYWRVAEQGDGSVKISNNFTGPDIFLDVDAPSLKPTLRAGDGDGTRWTMKSPASAPTDASSTTASTPQATTMGTVVSSAAASGVVSSSGSGGAASSACTAECSATSSPKGSSKLSSGAIAGIVVGAVVGVALLIFGAWFLLGRGGSDENKDNVQKPTQMSTDPMINDR